MKVSISNTSFLKDKIGIWASSLCAIHCLLLPMLVPVIPIVAASFFAEAWFERTILSVSLIIGFWALLSGYFRYHRRLYPLYGLLLGGLIYWNKDILGETYEPFLVPLGALLIVLSHVINIKLCKSCSDCQDCNSH